METYIGVRFKKAGRIYHFSPGQLHIEKGQHVIVETARGMECGLVVIGPREGEPAADAQPLKVVQRIANEHDLARVADNKKHEKEAYAICAKKIREHGLPMKLVDVEYTFDLNKIIFYFTADGRIDFRDLVKDLASVFRTRIELRQIGVRDEAKIMGGIGCCGRPLCCATFLGDFEPVSIRMAKEQNLSLNPTKISGICGRLMCCLKYESECYCNECPQKQKKVQPPQQGGRVVTMDGEGKVISLNQQRRTATILLDNSRTVVAAWEDVIEEEVETEEGNAQAKERVTENRDDTRRRSNQGGERRSARRERSEHTERPRRPRENRENNNRGRRSRRPRDARGERSSRPHNGPRRPKAPREKRENGQQRPSQPTQQEPKA
ncbi:PSP1 domain-containing protein [Mitsuokella sp. WILCCON 0060]|uniref:PSP1 domain-containing protein n=1 Tax=unclassified Mitsuokella TaxID=2637239 RepID=UPI003F123D10